MDKLRSLRDLPKAQYHVEAGPPQSMSIVESLIIWARLQKAFEWQLQQCANLFEPGHRENLIKLQARLEKLNTRL